MAGAARREVDTAHLRALAAASGGLLQVLAEPSPGSPRFELNLALRTAGSKRYPEQHQGHCRVLITLDPRHPFLPPAATVLTPIFHPNVFESGVVCMGAKWLPSEGMDLYVRRLVRLLAFDPLLVNTRSAAYSAALAWYTSALRQHPQAFPSDPAALRLGEPQGAAATAASPAPATAAPTASSASSASAASAAPTKVLRHCPHCQTTLRLPAGRSGVVACPRCQQDFEVQT